MLVPRDGWLALSSLVVTGRGLACWLSFPYPLQYPWTGETVEHPRRDKRKGWHRAHVARSEAGDPCIM